MHAVVREVESIAIVFIQSSFIHNNNNNYYCSCIQVHVYYFNSPHIAPPSVAVPFGVQALCSAVVWYSHAEVSCAEGTAAVNGYEVQFYDPNFIQSNVTRYVGTNRTFYGITEEDRLAGENTHVQVS